MLATTSQAWASGIHIDSTHRPFEFSICGAYDLKQ